MTNNKMCITLLKNAEVERTARERAEEVKIQGAELYAVLVSNDSQVIFHFSF